MELIIEKVRKLFFVLLFTKSTFTSVTCNKLSAAREFIDCKMTAVSTSFTSCKLCFICKRVNLIYTTVLVSCAAAVFAICYQYLNVQSAIKTNSQTVVELQNQLNSLKAENNSHESEINAGIDYDAIYDTAVNELGMVYPSRSQVVGYDSKESEYVKQYKDISK